MSWFAPFDLPEVNPNPFVSTKVFGSGLAVVGLVVSGRVGRAVFDMYAAELAGFDSWAVVVVDALENTLCSKVQYREFQSKNISGRQAKCQNANREFPNFRQSPSL